MVKEDCLLPSASYDIVSRKFIFLTHLCWWKLLMAVWICREYKDNNRFARKEMSTSRNLNKRWKVLWQVTGNLEVSSRTVQPLFGYLKYLVLLAWSPSSFNVPPVSLGRYFNKRATNFKIPKRSFLAVARRLFVSKFLKWNRNKVEKREREKISRERWYLHKMMFDKFVTSSRRQRMWKSTTETRA